MKTKVKQLLMITIILMINKPSTAQYCETNRFQDEDFVGSVTVTNDITYGSNTGVLTGTPQSLELDLYEPAGDTMSMRPLIIWAHGGSFIGGNKNNQDVKSLSTTFAKMGYVTASIEYRIGIFIPNQVTTTLAVMRAMHDMKAAVRFFRKDAATTNTYRIDPDNIIVAGVSAGAIAAIHAAYFDKDAEIPSYMVNDTAGLGGVEGNSGNPGYSSESVAVVNFAGAIGDTMWISSGDVPIISFHYNGDMTVPYDTREVSVSGFPTGLVASGSRDIHKRAENVEVVNQLETYIGQGHVDYLGTDYDSVVSKVKTFLYDNVICQPTTAVASLSSPKDDFIVYPNPASRSISFNTSSGKPLNLRIFNALGQLVFSKDKIAGSSTIDLSKFQKGMYIIQANVSATGEQLIAKKLVVE